MASRKIFFQIFFIITIHAATGLSKKSGNRNVNLQLNLSNILMFSPIKCLDDKYKTALSSAVREVTFNTQDSTGKCLQSCNRKSAIITRLLNDVFKRKLTQLNNLFNAKQVLKDFGMKSFLKVESSKLIQTAANSKKFKCVCSMIANIKGSKSALIVLNKVIADLARPTKLDTEIFNNNEYLSPISQKYGRCIKKASDLEIGIFSEKSKTTDVVVKSSQRKSLAPKLNRRSDDNPPDANLDDPDAEARRIIAEERAAAERRRRLGRIFGRVMGVLSIAAMAILISFKEYAFFAIIPFLILLESWFLILDLGYWF